MDSAFSNMVIEVTVRKVVPLAKGQKLTGRYGNKSVISEIRKDEDMPYTEDGRRIDLLLNLLAIINRTTSFPLYEIAITSICYQVRKRMASMDNYDDKEKLLFDIIRDFNDTEYQSVWKSYNNEDEQGKKAFIDDAIENGIYIHQKPMWEDEPIFYRLQKVLAKYDWLKPDTVYINKWGRKIKVLNKYWVGQMYVPKLKQSDRRGFSARSTGAVDTKGLPTRSFKSRSHQEHNSSTAIRFGEFETLNMSIGMKPHDIAVFNAYYRTSIKARADLVKLLFRDKFADGEQKIDKSYTSRVAEIFNVLMKSLSIRVRFVDKNNDIYPVNNTICSPRIIDGKIEMLTDYEYLMKQREAEARDMVLEEQPIITIDELEKKTGQLLLKDKRHVVGPYIESSKE